MPAHRTHARETETVPAEPRGRVEAAPLDPLYPPYPVHDPSPRDALLAADALPQRTWTQSRPGDPGGSLARDITILRRGLDGHIQRQRRALALQRRRRLWIACSGLGFGFLCGVVALFF